jgi:glycerol 3-phosphatase-2
MPLSPLLDAYDIVLLDLDGCVWVGNQATRGAAEAIGALRQAGKALAFVTNDSHHSPEEYVRKLWSLGVRASLDEVVTVGAAIQHFLAERGQGAPAYVIGSPAVFRHVSDSGQRVVNHTPRAGQAEVVVVAGHEELRLRDLQPAIQSVFGGAEMIATDRDPSYPSEEGVMPGTGAVVAALEYATGHSARIIGKPEPQLFLTALDRLDDGRALVVGDRLDADLAGAAAAGLDGAIVLSGSTDGAEAEQAENPALVAVAEDLHALVLGS